MQASKALYDGDWMKRWDLVQDIRAWGLISEIKGQPKRCSQSLSTYPSIHRFLPACLSGHIQEQGLRTWLFACTSQYSTFSLFLLLRTFIIEGCHINCLKDDDLERGTRGFFGFGSVIRGYCMTLPQQFAQTIAEKMRNMVEQNEKILDSKFDSNNV